MDEVKNVNSVIDPDYYYDIKEEPPSKKQKTDHDDEKNEAIDKIKDVISREFSLEISNKQSELDEIIHRIKILKEMLDKLRGCAVSSFYSLNQPSSTADLSDKNLSNVHPSVKSLFLGKAPKGAANASIKNEESINMKTNDTHISSTSDNKKTISNSDQPSSSRLKQKVQIIVGNVSRFIPPEKREYNDLSTHKWMVYVRTAKDQPSVEKLVSKVRFFLHPSYKPNDLVEVSNHPFHLTRRGWGEFPVRVQLYFHESRNKTVDVIHNLKLDKTFTGLQTLGAETAVDLLLYNGMVESFIAQNKDAPKDIPSAKTEDEPMDDSDNNYTIREDDEKSPKPEISDNSSNLQVKISSADKNYAKNNVIKVKEEHAVSIPDKNSIVLKTGQNSLKRYTKCKDQRGNIILIPVESLPSITKQLNSAAKVASTNDKLVKSISIHDLASKNGVLTARTKNMVKVMPPPDDVSSGQTLNSRSSIDQNVVNVIRPGTSMLTLSKPSNHVSILKSSVGVGETVFTSVLRQSPLGASSVERIMLTKKQLLDLKRSAVNESWASKIEKMETMTELVHWMTKKHPIISESEDKSVHHYCCKSLALFKSWPIEKQRACEWQRARAVAKACKEVVSKGWLPSPFKTQDVWTTKKILVWARKMAYTPCQPGPSTGDVQQSSLEDLNLLIKSSLSDPRALITSLQSDQSNNNPEVAATSSEEEIDVENLHCRPKKNEDNENDKVVNNENHVVLPSTFDSSFVNPLLSEIGVKIKPISIYPDVSAHVIEDMIFKAAQCFMEDLVRGAHSAAYDQERKGRVPQEVSILDVVMSILNNPSLDFLSHRNFGINGSSNSQDQGSSS